MPSSHNLEFAKEAEEDIRAILQYTKEQWGDATRRAYRKRLDAAFGHLIDHPRIGRSRDDFAPGLRSHPCGEHTIFYRVTDTEIVVRRVIHSRRDLGSETVS